MAAVVVDPYPKEGYCEEKECERLMPDIVDHFKQCHSGRNLSCPFNCGTTVTHFRNLHRHLDDLHGAEIGFCVNQTGGESSEEAEPPGLLSGDGLVEKLIEWGQSVDEVHVRKGHVFKYNAQRRMADFVFFRLTKETVKGPTNERSLFARDDALDAPQMTYHAYKVAGMDQGHTVPHASFKSFREVQEEVICYSVIVPMLDSFNVGAARALENHARTLATEHENQAVYVMTGPLTDENHKQRTAGGYDMYIPTHFWTVLVIVTKDGHLLLQAFKLAHNDKNEQIFHQRVTLEDLEECCGIPMLPTLPRQYTWSGGASSRHCYVCKINLPGEEYYVHRAEHMKENYCLNSSCLKRFDSYELLEEHRKICRKYYECEICGSGFRSEILLKNHLKRHASIRPFMCNSCDNRYAQLKSLQRHEKSAHGPPGKYYCDTCKKNLHTRYSFNAHMDSHRGLREYFCLVENCRNKNGFLTLAAVQDHLRQVHKIQAANQKELFEHRPLAPASDHAQMDKIREIREYFCLVENCTNVNGFTTKANVQSHLRNVHHIKAENHHHLFEHRPSPSASNELEDDDFQPPLPQKRLRLCESATATTTTSNDDSDKQ